MKLPASTLKIYTIQGRKARLHPECVDGFREDRKHGLIYGPYTKADGSGFYLNAEAFSLDTHTCPYCGHGSTEDEAGPFFATR